MNIELHPKEEEKDFFVKCNVCGQILKNWIGSTACCGSIAYSCDEDGGNVTDTIQLFGFISKEKK